LEQAYATRSNGADTEFVMTLLRQLAESMSTMALSVAQSKQADQNCDSGNSAIGCQNSIASYNEAVISMDYILATPIAQTLTWMSYATDSWAQSLAALQAIND